MKWDVHQNVILGTHNSLRVERSCNIRFGWGALYQLYSWLSCQTNAAERNIRWKKFCYEVRRKYSLITTHKSHQRSPNQLELGYLPPWSYYSWGIRTLVFENHLCIFEKSMEWDFKKIIVPTVFTFSILSESFCAHTYEVQAFISTKTNNIFVLAIL